MIDVIVEPKTTWKSEVMTILGIIVAAGPMILTMTGKTLPDSSLIAATLSIAGIAYKYLANRNESKARIDNANLSIRLGYDVSKDPGQAPAAAK